MSFLTKAMAQAAAGAGGVEKDEYFNQTTLLLHGDGSQGANNVSNPGPPAYVAFEDGSSNDFPITVNGDAYGTPFSPYNTSWSNYFDGTSDYLTAADSAELEFSGDFTVEGFFYYTGAAANLNPAVVRVQATGAVCRFDLNNGSTFLNVAGVTTNPTASRTTFTGVTVTPNSWVHIAWVRSSNVIKAYINGVASATTLSNSATTERLRQIGTGSGIANGFLGYISSFRMVDSAVYTSDFTPPTAYLTAISGTSLLTCQSNRFLDNSANNLALTVTGTPSVQPFSPFAETDTTTGSGYFDGSGDYFVVGGSGTSAQLGTGDFCVEAWFYSGSTATQYIFNNFNGSGSADTQWAMYDQTSEFRFGGWNTNFLIGTKPPRNQWNHAVVCRESGRTSLFINGVREATSTSTYNLTATNELRVGAHTTGTSPFNGYISHTRLVKGDSVYDPAQTTLTVPTSPATSDANTELLTCQYRGTVRNVGFIDSSQNRFLITRNGNTTQGTFSPFSSEAGKWSVYIGGVDDWVDIDNSSGALLGSGAWTMECWFYATTTSVQRQLLDFRYPSGGQSLSVFLQSSNEIAYWNGTVRITGGTVEPNQWNHVLCSRDGSNDVRLFLNGVQIGSEYNDTTNYTTAVCRFGCANTGADFQGYISNVRLVNGTAVQTSGFTVPTSPLTEVSGTTFLGLQSNRFVDNSTTPVTSVTPNDAVSIQPFSPFAPTSSYDPAVNGGSGYFDGTGDYLTVADDDDLDVEASDFTLEFFYYPLAVQAAGKCLFSKRANTSTFGTFLVYFAGSNLTPSLLATTNGSTWGISTASSESFILNQWNHCSVIRSGNTWKMFVNGVAGITATLSGTVPNNAAAVAIGAAAENGSSLTSACYMSGFRLLKGTAIDFASTGIPTAPPTDITNTTLLCNFTNAGIFDNTGKNNLETVGNAQVDTTTVKYGTGSMKFDGTGDNLLIPASPNLNFGSGDFTIEGWINFASGLGSSYLAVLNNNANISNTTGAFSVQIFPSDHLTFRFYNGSGATTVEGTSDIGDSTFHHFAVVRSGTTITLYIDGVSEATTTSSVQIGTSTTVMYVGRYTGASPIYWNGFVDDLRITKGVARYTSNFTVPDKAFPDQ